MESECFGACYFGALWSSSELRYFLHVTYSTLMRKILLAYHTNYLFFLGDITYVEDPTPRLLGKLSAETRRFTPDTMIKYIVRRPKYPSKSPLFLGSLSGYEPFLRFLHVGGRTGSEGRLAFSLTVEYLLSPTLSGGEAALPLRCLPA
jgi:hypothetical protein